MPPRRTTRARAKALTVDMSFVGDDGDGEDTRGSTSPVVNVVMDSLPIIPDDTGVKRVLLSLPAPLPPSPPQPPRKLRASGANEVQVLVPDILEYEDVSQTPLNVPRVPSPRVAPTPSTRKDDHEVQMELPPPTQRPSVPEPRVAPSATAQELFEVEMEMPAPDVQTIGTPSTIVAERIIVAPPPPPVLNSSSGGEGAVAAAPIPVTRSSGVSTRMVTATKDDARMIPSPDVGIAVVEQAVDPPVIANVVHLNVKTREMPLNHFLRTVGIGGLV